MGPDRRRGPARRRDERQRRVRLPRWGCRTMQHVVALRSERGVVVSAQVSYRDLAGFGRRFIDVGPAELTAEVVYQVGALRAFAEAVRSASPTSSGTVRATTRSSTPEGQAAALVEAARLLGDDLVALGLRDRLGCVVPRTPAPCGAHRPRHPRPTRDDDGGSRSPALSRRHAWPAHRGRDEPGPRDLRRRGRLRRLHLSRRRTLTSAEWSVTADVDRVGARLLGPTLERAVTDELPSEEVVRGSCDRAAQLVPGARVRLSRAGAPARRRAPR